jgi:hypothetical protein
MAIEKVPSNFLVVENQFYCPMTWTASESLKSKAPCKVGETAQLLPFHCLAVMAKTEHQYKSDMVELMYKTIAPEYFGIDLA